MQAPSATDARAISGPIEALRPVWEELTGGRLELGLVPVADLYAQLMLDRGRERRYDAAVIAAWFYGDLVAGNHLLPVTGLMASGRFPRWSYDGMPPALLFCEFQAVGFRLAEFVRKPELKGYYAQFEAAGVRPEPAAIKPCNTAKGKTGT